MIIKYLLKIILNLKKRERNTRAVASTTDTTISTSSVLSSNDMNGHVNIRDDLNSYIRTVSIPVIKYMDRIEVEAVPKRIFANAHTYHINSISLNSDQETFMSADDLRINLWHIEITNQSFSKIFYFISKRVYVCIYIYYLILLRYC